MEYLVYMVVLGATAGLVVAGVGSFVMKRMGKSPKLRTMVWVGVAVAIVFALKKAFLTPYVDAGNAEATLQEIPLYQALKAHEPVLYAEVVANLKHAIINGVPIAEVNASTRQLVGRVIEKRAPFASNEAIRSAVAATVDEVQMLYSRGGDSCFRMLFPATPGPPLDLPNLITQQMLDADLAAQAAIIRTSAESPQKIPNDAEVAPSLSKILSMLTAKYDEKTLAMLSDESAPGVDRRKVCAMWIDLFVEALKLPPDDGGRALRYLFNR